MSERRMGHVLPEHVEIGAMLETPSLAFGGRASSTKWPDFIPNGRKRPSSLVSFIRRRTAENERVRRRYDTFKR